MSRRVYLGKLAQDAQKGDIEKLFDGRGKLVDVRVMNGYGFVEFDSPADAEGVVRDFNGQDFLGERLIVEPAKESRRRENFDGPGGPPRGPPRRGVRVLVFGVPSGTSWQDLKDFGRLGGSGVSFADLDPRDRTVGIIEYPSLPDAEEAIRRLEGVDIHQQRVRLELDDARGGGGGGGYPPRDDRRREPPRDYGRDDRYGGGRDDRYRDDRYGRDRSPPRRRDDYRDRSPPRRDRDDRGGDRYPRDDRRERSPRRDRDDRYDDRRGAPAADITKAAPLRDDRSDRGERVERAERA